MMRKTQQSSSEDLFDSLKMFNHIVVSDEELAARLPGTEFELSFTCEGDIYVDGTPLGVNVKQRYEALALK
jgi:hypothetical protein